MRVILKDILCADAYTAAVFALVKIFKTFIPRTAPGVQDASFSSNIGFDSYYTHLFSLLGPISVGALLSLLRETPGA